MSTPLFIAAALFAWILSGHRADRTVRAYEEGQWRLEVRHDVFRQETQCRISNDYGHFPSVIAMRDFLILKLPGNADGSSAWFSVDGSAARPWREIEAALIARGALANAEALDNATGGNLPLPYEALNHARYVSVQVRTGTTPRDYPIDGLWRLLDAGKRLGCNFRFR